MPHLLCMKPFHILTNAHNVYVDIYIVWTLPLFIVCLILCMKEFIYIYMLFSLLGNDAIDRNEANVFYQGG